MGARLNPTREGGGNQRRTRENLPTKSKKSTRKNLGDDLSRRSKKTRSDDDASSLADATGNGDTPNLEAIKGSLRKKRLGSSTPKGSEKKAKKTATFTEAVSKGATEKSMPAIAHKKCVVAFSVRVDKGKDTQAAFGKKSLPPYPFSKRISASRLDSSQSTDRSQTGHP